MERLREAGFYTPPLPFWAVITLYYWALGEKWENLTHLIKIDEGDLVMVILRTAEHLRQIESLEDIPELSKLAHSATVAIEQILREPVLVR